MVWGYLYLDDFRVVFGLIYDAPFAPVENFKCDSLSRAHFLPHHLYNSGVGDSDLQGTFPLEEDFEASL